MKFSPLRFPFALSALFLAGCAAAPIIPGPERVDLSALPRQSPDATEVLFLQSNVNCQFFVDGQPMVKGRRVRVLVTRQHHKVTCKPEGYVAKDEYVQPPFDPRFAIGFTFLMEDKLEARVAPPPGAAPGAPGTAPRIFSGLDDLAGFFADSLARQVERDKRVAVYGFLNAATMSRARLSAVWEDALMAQLSQRGVPVVARGRLEDLVRELRFQLSDLVDPKSASRLGKLLGAQLMVTGGIYDAADEGVIRVSLQAIEAETGAVRLALQGRLLRTAALVNLLTR